MITHSEGTSCTARICNGAPALVWLSWLAGWVVDLVFRLVVGLLTQLRGAKTTVNQRNITMSHLTSPLCMSAEQATIPYTIGIKV